MNNEFNRGRVKFRGRGRGSFSNNPGPSNREENRDDLDDGIPANYNRGDWRDGNRGEYQKYKNRYYGQNERGEYWQNGNQRDDYQHQSNFNQQSYRERQNQQQQQQKSDNRGGYLHLRGRSEELRAHFEDNRIQGRVIFPENREGGNQQSGSQRGRYRGNLQGKFQRGGYQQQGWNQQNNRQFNQHRRAEQIREGELLEEQNDEEAGSMRTLELPFEAPKNSKWLEWQEIKKKKEKWTKYHTAGKENYSTSIPIKEFLNSKKKIEYEHGMNQKGRSVYELHEYIPKFSDEVKAMEKLVCKTLFDITKSSELPVTVDTLLIKYLTACEKGGHERIISSPEALDDFLKSHSHVFKITDGGTIQNRGFGYRRGMCYLSCILLIKSNSDRITNLDDVFDEIEGLPFYHPAAAWLDDYLFKHAPSGDQFEVVNFLKKHSTLFEVDRSDYSYQVRIKDQALTIPSLWDSTILPYIEEYLDYQLDQNTGELKPKIYNDYSRTFYMKGRTVNVKKNYCKVIITEGTYKRNFIYVLASHVGKATTNFEKAFPDNALVQVKAHPVFFGKTEFRAVEIEKVTETEEEKIVYEAEKDKKMAKLDSFDAVWEPLRMDAEFIDGLEPYMIDPEIEKLHSAIIIELEQIMLEGGMSTDMIQEILDKRDNEIIKTADSFIFNITQRPDLYKVDVLEDVAEEDEDEEKDIVEYFDSHSSERRQQMKDLLALIPNEGANESELKALITLTNNERLQHLLEGNELMKIIHDLRQLITIVNIEEEEEQSESQEIGEYYLNLDFKNKDIYFKSRTYF